LRLGGLGCNVGEHQGPQEIHGAFASIEVKNNLHFFSFLNKGLLGNMVGRTLGDVENDLFVF
jgi:hypothetical protein